MKKTSLWSARFKQPVDERVKRFTASVAFDQRLAKYDIEGSLAHARMLAARGVLPRRDLAAIVRGLARLKRDIERGGFAWSIDAEDVHLNVEQRLICACGCAPRSTKSGASSWRSSARCSPRRAATRRWSCPGSPICKWRSRSPSATT
jgi:argininosuccinate lyase